MDFFDYIQLAAVGSLLAYMIYLLYYYTVPMCCFKLILFRAIRKKECLGMQSGDGKIPVRYLRHGREQRYTKAIDQEVPDRFLAIAACHTLRSILEDIRNGVV